MKNVIYLLSILLIGFSGVNAQSAKVAVGGWREHIPYSKAIDVEESNDGMIYCASSAGLFSYNKSNGEVNAFSRLTELSDLEVALIEYDRATGVLIVAYLNSNIDIIYPDKTILNLPDIKQKNIVGGKHINAIIFINSFAYLACDFGIVVIDLVRHEIKDTYYIAQNGVQIIIHDIAYNGTEMIAATDNGIYRANFNDPNIFNYTGWTKDLTLVEPNANYTSAATYNGKFYAVKTLLAWAMDTVLQWSNNTWTVFDPNGHEGGFVDNDENYLYYGNIWYIDALDANNNSVSRVDGSSYANPNFKNAIRGTDGNMWIADFQNGLVLKRPDGSTDKIFPNGPSSSAAWHMASHGGTLWVSTGSIIGDSPEYSAKNGVFRFADNQWQSYDCTNDALYQQLCSYGSPATNYVAIDPADPNHAFIASYGTGILEYRKDGGVAKYNAYNSTLHPISVDTSKVNIGGVEFDSDANLWSIGAGNTKPLSVRKPNGAWVDFFIADPAAANFSFYNMLIDDYGQKWFCARNSSTGEGLCVFKEKSINETYNGSYKQLTDATGNGALPDMFVRSIAKDKDGSIWVGTNQGVAVIYNPGNVFVSGENFDAQRIIIQQDGYNQYLLETEFVTAIAVDGANRKWFGTYGGGVFLMSADGQKQLLTFNIDNSPLPSNSISSIAIDDVTGEVFIATDKGIISYRGDATEGGEACVDKYAFPNPVKSDYHGPIAIRGLVADADVKIADVAGNVVYHTKANGGEAIWYGTNFSGERAATGVYIVYISNEDGTQTCTTKILFGN
jgi:ligand-binding sensor domain-containing protein